MEAFMHQGRYIDATSQIAFEWRSETTDPVQGSVAVTMVAIKDNFKAQVTTQFTEVDLIRASEQDLIRECMFRAKRQLLDHMARTPRENTRGVLRHLVRMARTVAA